MLKVILLYGLTSLFPLEIDLWGIVGKEKDVIPEACFDLETKHHATNSADTEFKILPRSWAYFPTGLESLEEKKVLYWSNPNNIMLHVLDQDALG